MRLNLLSLIIFKLLNEQAVYIQERALGEDEFYDKWENHPFLTVVANSVITR